MKYMLSQIADVGSINPIVARLMFQTAELIEPFGLTQQQRDGVLQALATNVRERLVSCHKIHNSIFSKLLEINNTNIGEYIKSD